MAFLGPSAGVTPCFLYVCPLPGVMGTPVRLSWSEVQYQASLYRELDFHSPQDPLLPTNTGHILSILGAVGRGGEG